MSSIKERAEPLNLEEKLCVHPQTHGVSCKSVQSPSMWSGLIFHLRSSVTVKRRRVHLKSHSDCFLGSEAVDVLAGHIHGKTGFEGANVSREKVVCVCQALLDCGVFESVGTKVFGKDKKQDMFQDSKSALYRFVGVCSTSVVKLERGLLANGIQTLFFSSPKKWPEEQTCPSDSQMCTPIRSTHALVKAKQLDPSATASLLAEPLVNSHSLSPSKLQTDTILPKSLVDEVWQEQTLLRLLNLVELPLLEGVLQCKQAASSPPTSDLLDHSNPDRIYSSTHLDRHILNAFRESQGDEWLCAALHCLDFLPDQPVMELSRELPLCSPQQQGRCEQLAAASISHDGGQSLSCDGQAGGLIECKQLLYRTLVKHYSHTDRPPLLPLHLTDVYTAITDLLVNAKLDKTMEALQLCLKLLPAAHREELQRLLTFLALAADPQGIKLEKEMENRLAVKRSFSRAVFHSRALSKENEDLMVIFMLSNIKDIFKIPGALHKRVSEKLASLIQGKQPDVTGSPFCQQVPSRTHNESTKKTTNQELWALLNNIHLDDNISAKEKKRLLGQFYKAHPQIYNQYFGESAVSLM